MLRPDAPDRIARPPVSFITRPSYPIDFMEDMGRLSIYEMDFAQAFLATYIGPNAE